MDMDAMELDREDSQEEEELPDIDDLPLGVSSSEQGGTTGSAFDPSLPSTSKGAATSSGKKMPTTGTAVKDSDGFLAPPPASTLLIRRTRTSSTGGSTYVVTPTTADADTSPPLKRRFSSGDFGGKGGHDDDEHVSVDESETFESESFGEEGWGSEVGGGGKRMKNYQRLANLKKGIRGRKRMFSQVEKIKEKLKVRKPVNIDPATGKRRYKKRSSLPFTMHRKRSIEPMTEALSYEAPEAEEDDSKEVVSLTWRPIDDLRLIVNTLQTNDLKQVHMGVKFSCRYTLQEIRDRWSNLMYNDRISKVALTACRNLHSKVKRRVYAEALFSEAELKKLESISSSSNPTLATFEELLKENALVFHEGRTAKKLQRCWMELKELHMLNNQDVKKHFERGSEDFADFETSVTDEDVRNLSVDPAIMHEILHEERRNKKRIRILEQEIGAWQSLADLVWEGQIIKAPDFDDNTFALIRGKNVRFAMAAKEITLGRRTRDNWVDADLSEEGNDTKISRRQATIKMRALGDFVILNQGKHAMYIDGQALLPGEVAYLHDQSVIRVSTLTFVFIINEKLLNDLRKKIIEEESNAEHIEIVETNPRPSLPPSPSRTSSLSKSRSKDSSPFREGGSSRTKQSHAGSNPTPKARKSVIVSPKVSKLTLGNGEGQIQGENPPLPKPPAKRNPPKKSAPRKPKVAPAASKVNSLSSPIPHSVSSGQGPTLSSILSRPATVISQSGTTNLSSSSQMPGNSVFNSLPQPVASSVRGPSILSSQARSSPLASSIPTSAPTMSAITRPLVRPPSTAPIFTSSISSLHHASVSMTARPVSVSVSTTNPTTVVTSGARPSPQVLPTANSTSNASSRGLTGGSATTSAPAVSASVFPPSFAAFPGQPVSTLSNNTAGSTTTLAFSSVAPPVVGPSSSSSSAVTDLANLPPATQN